LGGAVYPTGTFRPDDVVYPGRIDIADHTGRSSDNIGDPAAVDIVDTVGHREKSEHSLYEILFTSLVLIRFF
jgi:hypothetical protein